MGIGILLIKKQDSVVRDGQVWRSDEELGR